MGDGCGVVVTDKMLLFFNAWLSRVATADPAAASEVQHMISCQDASMGTDSTHYLHQQ
jgi:hypothetical protein